MSTMIVRESKQYLGVNDELSLFYNCFFQLPLIFKFLFIICGLNDGRSRLSPNKYCITSIDGSGSALPFHVIDILYLVIDKRFFIALCDIVVVIIVHKSIKISFLCCIQIIHSRFLNHNCDLF